MDATTVGIVVVTTVIVHNIQQYVGTRRFMQREINELGIEPREYLKNRGEIDNKFYKGGLGFLDRPGRLLAYWTFRKENGLSVV